MSLRWLFLDMNAFFASVEQQEHPELRGRPVAVVPMLADTTCCIAASYEAKAFGVKTGTNVAEAKRLCPNLCLVEAKHGPYRAYHEAIKAVVADCLPEPRVLSVDEMVCRLWANERTPEEAVALGERIKREIRVRVGECLTCSVGLSVNPFLAKVAAEMHKPDGLTVLPQSDLPHALYPLRLTDFPGISRRMEARFFAAGVFTTEQMCGLSRAQMRDIWGGVTGELWWRLLRDPEADYTPTVRRCVGHSHVLPPELRTRRGAAAVTVRLLEKAAARMRHLGYHACGLAVQVRNGDGQKWSRKVKLAPCQDTWTLMDALYSLEEHPFPTPRQVGVMLYDLRADADVIPSLFGDQERRARAARAVDALNRRFGGDALHLASVLAVTHTAEDKIAFGKIH